MATKRTKPAPAPDPKPEANWSRAKASPPDLLPEDMPEARTRRCLKEIQDSLTRNRCMLVPGFAEPEMVGEYGSGILLKSNYRLVPK